MGIDWYLGICGDSGQDKGRGDCRGDSGDQCQFPKYITLNPKPWNTGRAGLALIAGVEGLDLKSLRLTPWKLVFRIWS